MCCWYVPRHRYFFSKDEEIEMLKKYKNELEKEVQGVEQRLQELTG
jgi:prefoldin subunit 5